MFFRISLLCQLRQDLPLAWHFAEQPGLPGKRAPGICLSASSALGCAITSLFYMGTGARTWGLVLARPVLYQLDYLSSIQQVSPIYDSLHICVHNLAFYFLIIYSYFSFLLSFKLACQTKTHISSYTGFYFIFIMCDHIMTFL